MKIPGDISNDAGGSIPHVQVPDRDAELLLAFAQGDARAARELAARLAPRAYAIAFRRLQDTAAAEDVAQDALLRLWKIAPAWEPGRAMVSTWLHTVVGNLCIDRQRAAGRRKEDSDQVIGDLESGSESIETALIRKDRAYALHQALGSLPVRQREAVSLRHLDELGNAEIAGIMGIGVEAVESLVARGRKKLADVLSRRKSLL